MKRFADSRQLGVSATAAIAIVAASAAAGAAEPTRRSPAEAIVESLGVHGGLCVQVRADMARGRTGGAGLPGPRAGDDEQAVERSAVGCGRPACTAWCPPTGCPFRRIAPRRTRQPAAHRRGFRPGVAGGGDAGPLLAGSWWSAQRERPRANWSHSASRLSAGGRGSEWLAGKAVARRNGRWTHPRHSAAGSPARPAGGPPRRVLGRRRGGEVRGMVTAAGRNSVGRARPRRIHGSASGSTTWLRPPASGSR